MYPLIQQLSSAIELLAPPEAVSITGEWSHSRRKSYMDASQLGSGMGPFVEIVDHRWRGSCACAVPLAGFGFMVTPTAAFWVKSPPATLNPMVQVSFHVWADYQPGQATFAANMLGSYLPAVPVASVESPAVACSLGPGNTTTGRAHTIASIDGVEFIAVFLPQPLLKVGRNRLWRFRSAYTPALPLDVQQFLQGRTGTLPPTRAE